MDIILIGNERLAYHFGKLMISKGHRVTLIHPDAETSSLLARKLPATVIHGDGSNPDVLYQAGAHTSDVFIAVTAEDQDNLVACQLARSYFHIPQILAMVNDPDNEDVFRHFGIKTFSPTTMMGQIIEELASFDSITNFLPIGDGKVSIAEIALQDGSPVIGQMLKDIRLPEDCLLTCILRGDQAIIPRGNTTLERKDRVLVVSKPDIYADIVHILSGE